MKRIAALLTVALLGGPACLAQEKTEANQTAFCEDVAAHVRPSEKLEIGLGGNINYPLGQLTEEPSPLLEPAATMGRPAKDTLDQAYHPTAELDAFFSEYAGDSGGDYVQVLGFPGSTVHGLWSLGGSDDCMTYRFFDAPAGGAAHSLPPLPAWLHTENEGLCDPHAGYLVRWKGQVGFLIRDAGEDFSARLRYAPLIEGQWAHGCAITLDVPILYRPRKIFVVSDGVPSRATLETALPKIAGLAIHSREGNFAFSDDGTAPRPIRTTITFSSREKIVLPLFGADDPEAAALQISGPDQWGTARLGGHSYLLRVNGAYGAAAKWPLTTIIFYDFSEGKTVVTGGDAPDPPLASAVVEIAPGSPAMSVSKGE